MSAPGATEANRIKQVDRNDLIEDLRKASKENSDGNSTSERRKALRETAREKYAEKLGVEADGLNKAEEMDMEAIVNWLIDSNAATSPLAFSAPMQAPAAFYPGSGAYQAPAYYQAPGHYAPATYQAPGMYSPVFPTSTTYVQPMMPVQILVPVAPHRKHGLFHW
jgi:hypothetical protein